MPLLHRLTDSSDPSSQGRHTCVLNYSGPIRLDVPVEPQRILGVVLFLGLDQPSRVRPVNKLWQSARLCSPLRPSQFAARALSYSESTISRNTFITTLESALMRGLLRWRAQVAQPFVLRVSGPNGTRAPFPNPWSPRTVALQLAKCQNRTCYDLAAHGKHIS